MLRANRRLVSRTYSTVPELYFADANDAFTGQPWFGRDSDAMVVRAAGNAVTPFVEGGGK